MTVVDVNDDASILGHPAADDAHENEPKEVNGILLHIWTCICNWFNNNRNK